MTTLTNTQSIILTAAAARPDRVALPLPANLRGGAAAKVVNAMLAKGLVEEAEADVRKGEEVWRETGDGHGVTIVATEAGIAAVGADQPTTSKPREGTKQAALIEMLKRAQGATLNEIVEATGWQPHTARGAMSGALKKRLGLTVTSEKEERGRVYRIAS